jgi:hypothetical protein
MKALSIIKMLFYELLPRKGVIQVGKVLLEGVPGIPKVTANWMNIIQVFTRNLITSADPACITMSCSTTTSNEPA